MNSKENVQVAAAIIRRADKILIAKRLEGTHKGGYWEFPGGKIEVGESPEEALEREIAEEIAISIKDPQPISTIQYAYPEKHVSLHFFLVTEFQGTTVGLEGQEIRWVKLSELANYQFPEANRSVIETLLAGQ